MADGPRTSLYRRHRPQAFAEVVGQEHVVRTLANAVDRDRIHHAYLFVGTRGTGKTSIAKILARSLNCEQGPTLTPCGECESCRTIAAGTSLDVIEMDAASNRSVEDIRELRERVGFAPAAGRWKVYILDEAHMLTREAWNAFLKTLEEPPPNTVFVLATTEPHKVMPTIVDRCQRFDFQRPAAGQIAEVVQRVAAAEGLEIDPEAVAAIARAATGSFRDALGTLDQLVAYQGGRITAEDALAVLGIADAELVLAACEAIAAADARAALSASERLATSGRDIAQFGRDLLARLRLILVTQTLEEVPETAGLTPEEAERLRAIASRAGELATSRAIDAVTEALAQIREGDEPRMALELALLRSARPQLDPSRQALMQRIERLEGSRGSAPDYPNPAGTAAAGGIEPEAGGHGGDALQGGGADSPAGPEDAGIEGSGPVAVAAPERAGRPDPAEAWPAVVAHLRDTGADLLATVISDARPVGIDSEQAVLRVGFPARAAFNKRKAETQEARDRLADTLQAVLGERLRPVFVLIEDSGAGEVADERAAEEPVSEEELIDRIKSEFDATELIDTQPEAQASEKTESEETQR